MTDVLEVEVSLTFTTNGVSQEGRKDSAARGRRRVPFDQQEVPFEVHSLFQIFSHTPAPAE